jgi:hypothetical protein
MTEPRTPYTFDRADVPDHIAGDVLAHGLRRVCT